MKDRAADDGFGPIKKGRRDGFQKGAPVNSGKMKRLRNIAARNYSKHRGYGR